MDLKLSILSYSYNSFRSLYSHLSYFMLNQIPFHSKIRTDKTTFLNAWFHPANKLLPKDNLLEL